MTSKEELCFLNWSNMKLSLRDARPDDIEHIFHLTYSRMNEILQKAFIKKGGYSWRKWKNGLKQALFLPGEKVKIIEASTEHDSFVGFYWASSEEVIWVTAIIISPEWQKKGIGRKIMNHIEKTLQTKDQKYIELGVQEKNPAIKFYEKLGFEPVERWSCQTIIMRKELEIKK